jgi:ATP-dependent Lon protease
LGKAKVTACDRVKDRAENWLPNILVVGLNYAQAITSICETGRTLNEISLGGVQGNDFLFGDEMSYYCSGCGELMSSITNGESFPSAVLFSDVDLMGTTVRSSNPLYGLASLLRRHTFHDFYMRELTIDVSDIQFICQVNRLEDCPELLLREMDIIVEL